MSEPQKKMAFDITNLVLNAVILVVMGVSGFFGAKAYNKIDETHDLTIRGIERMDNMKEHQAEQDAQLAKHDTQIFNLLTLKNK